MIMSVGKGRRMKGYLSIRETSYKWGISERRVNQYVAREQMQYNAEQAAVYQSAVSISMWHRDAFPVQSVSGVHGQSLMMP